MASKAKPVGYGAEFKADRWALVLPKSQREIEAIHRAKKRLALARAKQSKFLAKRMSGVDARKIDDPHEWAKIPVLTKDELRKLSTEEFYRDFCIAGFDRALKRFRRGRLPVIGWLIARENEFQHAADERQVRRIENAV